MTTIHPGRFTAPSDREITVFLIGMRVNKLHRIDAWWPVAAAMPRMLRHLQARPETGLLGHESWFGRTSIMLSYWRDAQSLQAFASDSAAPHLEPWRRFMRTIGSSGLVGIWHETYVVPAGSHESVYANMPRFGLAGATEHVPIGRGTHTARQRLRADAVAPTQRDAPSTSARS